MSTKPSLRGLSVVCPVCKAGIDVPCKRPRSRPGSHNERLVLEVSGDQVSTPKGLTAADKT